MAVDSTTVWELRTSGSEFNGGLFADLNPGTSVDYSQQDSAQLSVSDIVTDAGGTGVSSATGGFTAAMEGNGIMIYSGSGLTTGYYQITGYTDTNNITIDRSAGSSGSGGNGAVGGAIDWGTSLDDNMMNTVAAGNTIYMKSGTYTCGFTNTYGDGGQTDVIRMIGYTSSRRDTCEGTDRPLIDLGGTVQTFGGFWFVYNLRFKLVSNDYIDLGGDSNTFHNCKFGQTGDNSTTRLVYCDNGALSSAHRFYGCEFVGSSQADDVNLVDLNTIVQSFIGCYFHGAGTSNARGLATYSRSAVVINCVFESLSTGVIGYSTDYSPGVINCVFYNLTSGLYVSASGSPGAVNCIFHTTTYGLNGSVAGESQISWNCYFYNNSTDNADGDLDPLTDVTGTDPQLNDPANGDFTLASGSPCFNAGIGLSVAGVS